MLLHVDSGVDAKKSFTNVTMRMLLGLVAASFNLRPSLKKYLKTAEGWLNFTAGITTESGSVACAIEFNNGKVKVLNMIPEGSDVVLVFQVRCRGEKTPDRHAHRPDIHAAEKRTAGPGEHGIS